MQEKPNIILWHLSNQIGQNPNLLFLKFIKSAPRGIIFIRSSLDEDFKINFKSFLTTNELEFDKSNLILLVKTEF